MKSDIVATSLAQIKRNLRTAFSSTVLVGLFGVITLALNARALSLGDVGILATVQAYAMLLNGVLALSTTMPVMRYGAAATEHGNNAELYGLMRFGLGLDIIAGLVTAGCALLIATVGGEAMNVSSAVRGGLLYYVPALLFSALLSSIGLLRLAHRFEAIRTIEVGSAAATLSVAALFWWIRAPLEHYFIAYAIIYGATPLVRYFVARVEIRRHFPRPAGASTALSPERRREFIVFAFSGTIGNGLETLRNTVDVVIASHLFSNEAVGVYGVAKRLAGVFRKFSQFSSTVSFVEITRLVERGQLRESRQLYRHILWISAAIGAAAIIGSVIAGKWALTYAFGEAYAAGYTVFVILVTAVAAQFLYSPVFMYVQVLRGATQALWCSIAGLIVAAVIIYPLATSFGPEGLAATIVFFILASLLCGLVLIRAGRHTGAPLPLDGVDP